MKPERPNNNTRRRLASRRVFFLATALSVLVSSTVASPEVYAQADQAFDPTEEDLKGEGLIGPPVFGQPNSSGSDVETIPGSATGFNEMNSGGFNSGTADSWAPPSVPTWQHPAAQQFNEPLSNSRSAWQPMQSGSSAGQAPPSVQDPGTNDEAWNLWLNMAQQQKQPSSPSPAYGAAAQIAGFGQQPAPGQNTNSTQPAPGDRNAITNGAGWTQSNIYSGWNTQASRPMPSGGNADYVPVPPPQQVAGQMGTSQQPAPQGDFIGGFMNWLGQMPNPFNQGPEAPQGNGAPPVLSSIFPQGMPDLSGLQQAASSFSLPNITPSDPNNPLSSPMASYVAGAIGSWVWQQMRSSNPFQLGSAMPPAMPAASSLPNLFPTALKLEARGESAPQTSDSQNIMDSELADSLLSTNNFPASSSGGSQKYSSRPTTFRGPLGIPVPGLLGNALASQRNKFALNYLLNRSLKGSGFGIRLR